MARVHIDESKCEGHGRCYALASSLFEADELGQGRVIGDGTIPDGGAHDAQLAVDNCPEQAVSIEE